MWTMPQGRAIGKVVGEFRDNPVNAPFKLHTAVYEMQEYVQLEVRLESRVQGVKDRVDTFHINQVGFVKHIK